MNCQKRGQHLWDKVLVHSPSQRRGVLRNIIKRESHHRHPAPDVFVFGLVDHGLSRRYVGWDRGWPGPASGDPFVGPVGPESERLPPERSPQDQLVPS
jgi:hypothetical protein